MHRVVSLKEDINSFLSSHKVDVETFDFLMKMKKNLDKVYSTDSSKTNKKLDIEKTLRSIGKKAFVDCYDILKKAKKDDKWNIVHLIKKYGGAKNENSARTKVSVGKKIFNENMEKEALQNIITSKKVDEETKNRALIILQREEEA